MKTFGQRLVESREKRHISQKELAERLNITPTRLNYWEKDKREPAINMIKLIAQILDVDANYLVGHSSNKNTPLYSSEALALADDYDKRLDTWGKKQVRMVADNELLRIQAALYQRDLDDVDTVQFSVTEYDEPMSAGTGQPAGYGYGNNLLLTKEPPRGTSYVAPIAGDSMEPTFHDGDKLFIQACYSIAVGEIGVFYMDGSQWVKELGEGVLLSHNPEYEPRPMTEDIRCQGRVLGVCDDSYFE